MVVGNKSIAPTIENVKAEIIAQRIIPARQLDLYLNLWEQYPDLEWGRQCAEEARKVKALMQEFEAISGHPSQPPSAANHGLPSNFTTTATSPTPDAAAGHLPTAIDYQKMHFVWADTKEKIKAEQLRECIGNLADMGLISRERTQQEALRRGLGYTCNEAERNSEAPRVIWLGPTDMLWMLVDGLWRLNLIYSNGGSQQKWNTACGVFLHADRTPYTNNLRNARCTNAKKKEEMNLKFLGPLARMAQSK
ncbi:MAG: hypothetical protein IJU19_01375 [Bacteroidales bacterium]|nr:hypothetical protein [Bacteroidales bacterium]